MIYSCHFKSFYTISLFYSIIDCMFPVTYLARLGELTLKGGNIKEFENRLVHNTKSYLESVKAHVQLRAGRMYIDCPEESCAAVEFTLNHLIGITGWAKTHVCEKSLDSIKKAVMIEALKAKEKGAKTFKIETRRSEKSFPLNSYELSCEAAGEVFDQKILSVDVHNPDLTIRIEIRERCFVYSDAQKGCRGLPVGTGGKGLLLLSGGLDSPVAGYRMMRRGMKVSCVYFHAYPYTSAEAQKKVEDLAQIISLYGIETHINIIPFTDVQLAIRKLTKDLPYYNDIPVESYSTLLLRMCMMKTASILAQHIHSQCLITGESLGQVASQTIENMAVTEHACSFPLVRPLIGLDKEEIIDTAKFIQTYETSILPYEDCCVLFSPKHPVLKARIEDASALFEKLNVDHLLQEAFEKREIKGFSAKKYVEEHCSR